MALPINIPLMHVKDVIMRDNLKPVTSAFIREPSSKEFHHEGLFSEEIFGQVGSPDRLVTFGYIELRTKIIHPFIYGNMCRLKALYGEILAGKTYAVFNTTTHDFDRADSSDEGADTGYKFFISHIQNIEFKKNNSLSRNDKIDQFNKYREILLIDQCLVVPAGIRDMSIEDGRPEKGTINEPYASLLNYTRALPPNGSENQIYDSLRFSIQKKVNEIFGMLFDMIEGKYGFFQRKYGSRNLALGTRNVISESQMAAESPDDPQYLKIDEFKLPVFQASKMYAPLLVYNLRELFFNEIFSQESDQVALIDPKTLMLQYHPVNEEEKQKFLSSDGIEKLSNLYRDREFRTEPVLVYNENNEGFYIYMIYDDEEDIYITRSISELKSHFDREGLKFNPDKVRSITYIEMFYIAMYRATLSKSATITRYPAIGIGSDVPAKAHLVSTQPARKVNLRDHNDFNSYILLPEYPILGKQSIDSTQLHPSVLDSRMGLQGDFDGDTVSVSGALSEEANKEIGDYLSTIGRYLHTNGAFYTGKTDLISLSLFNLTRDPE